MSGSVKLETISLSLEETGQCADTFLVVKTEGTNALLVTSEKRPEMLNDKGPLVKNSASQRIAEQ